MKELRKKLISNRYGELYGLSKKMEKIKERYFERLNVFKRNSFSYNKNILNLRYGELYGLLDSMRILDIISYGEYCHLIKELDSIYDNTFNQNKKVEVIKMEKFERAMEIAITVTSENCDAPYDALVSKIFIELNKNDLVEYYDIITKLMCETRNHLRISNDL